MAKALRTVAIVAGVIAFAASVVVTGGASALVALGVSATATAAAGIVATAATVASIASAVAVAASLGSAALQKKPPPCGSASQILIPAPRGLPA